MNNLDAITPPLNIPKNALVLELGSGHRPHPRANVLSDKYLEDIERGGGLITDRPFIQTGAEKLPFQDQSFDFVLCRHVLEHLETPTDFFKELSRVGKAGYIETPSMIWEQLHPSRAYHRWLVLEINGELIMQRKPMNHTETVFGDLFEHLNAQSPEYRLFLRRYADLFYVRHYWKGRINYAIESVDMERRSWFDQPWDKAKAAHFVPTRGTNQQAKDLLVGAFGSVWGGFRRRFLKFNSRPQDHQVDLVTLLQCPDCTQSTIIINDSMACCQNCNWETMVILPQ